MSTYICIYMYNACTCMYTGVSPSRVMGAPAAGQPLRAGRDAAVAPAAYAEIDSSKRPALKAALPASLWAAGAAREGGAQRDIANQ